MSKSDPSPWQIKSVALTDFLGYQGEVSFDFEAGLQVIHAANHTGKTSLALGILWGLTGQVPALPRITKTSFRLSNKHKGENAAAAVTIRLQTADGSSTMAVKRAYSGARGDIEKDLVVEKDGEQHPGQDGQDLIEQELNISAGSLEGCGVVLQDHRLKLITGSDANVSEVINDMLGLYTLSQLVPTLDAKAADAAALRKEIDGYLADADPLKRWEERAEQLDEEIRAAEDRAIEAGFTREELEDSTAAAATHLDAIQADLNMATAEGLAPDARVEALRKGLQDMRKSSPETRELTDLQVKKEQTQKSLDAVQGLRGRFDSHAGELETESARGEMDAGAVSRTIAEQDALLEKNRQRRADLDEEQKFVQVAYEHLLSHQDEEACPLCNAATSNAELVARTKARLEDTIADELEKMAAADKAAASAKKAAEARLKQLKQLKQETADAVEAGLALTKGLGTRGEPLLKLLDADSLFLDKDRRNELSEALQAIVPLLQADIDADEKAYEEKLHARQQVEETLFQPAETRINNIKDSLLPVQQAHGRLDAHGKLRDEAAAAHDELGKLQKETKAFSQQLKSITKALAEHERETAAAAVNQQMPKIKEFFKSVAANPDYDGLAVTTDVKRDKVTYKLQATSDSVGNLNDAVGHVLSEGDLSAAAMALLMGLAGGSSHRMGFMLLDDPAQGMDNTLQANFAQALAAMDDSRQIVILTHQESFADALEKLGASCKVLGSWKGGKIQDAK